MNVLSLAYLGNIRWFSKLCYSDCIVDIHENYKKQSYRNRCEILSAGGRTSLTVNVVNPGNYSRTAVRDVRIDHSKRWRHTHWQSLVSAYANSPYFDHYAARFEPFYTREFTFLYDLNAGLLETVLEILGCPPPVYSERYIDTGELGVTAVDYRDSISPKPRLNRADPHFTDREYWQVFSDRFPFQRQLSIVDLIFCEGPYATEILKDCYVP